MKEWFRPSRFVIRGEQGFFDKSATVRVLISVLFGLSLFFFLHNREVSLEVIELNTTAERYIVAQVDYEFPDTELTAILRQEALRDVSKIYRIGPSQLIQVQSAIENELTHDDEWRLKAPHTTFEEMYLGVDRVTRDLSEARFTDPRTLRKMVSMHFPTAHYTLYSPSEGAEPTHLPQEFWGALINEAFGKSELQEAAIETILTRFEGQKWQLDEDRVAMRSVRQAAVEAVPPVVTRMKAGSRIIDKGEEVTGRHIASLQAMYSTISAARNLWSPVTLLGTLILTLLFTGVIWGFIYLNHAAIFFSNRRLCLMTVIFIVTLGLAKATEYLLIGTSALTESVRFPILVPFAAIMFCSLLNGRLATFLSGFLAVVMAITLAVDGGEFLVINLLASLVAVFTMRNLRRRKEVFVICGKAWFCCALVVCAFHLYANSFLTLTLLVDLLSTLIFMLVTAIVVVGLLPLLESGFRVLTDVSLMEYMDPTHPLLRRLSIEAPGTYQHSIVVGNLAEAAAIAVGANGLFCRVATLYHDIGKLISPQYFTENQQPGVDIHRLLTPLESAQAIMAHVSEGVALARKAGIPEPIIDIIKEHHGTTLVYFFYHKACQLAAEGEKVKELDFRYTGPKPHKKEAAIIMICDTMEAASRSQEELSETTLNEMIDRLVRGKAEDGQFDECDLTFEELCIVKRTIVHSLVVAGHSRVKYPSSKPPGDTPEENPALI